MEEVTPFIWNPILRQHLVNAPSRMNRREGTDACPFCADIIEGKVPPDAHAWLHPNDFPPVQPPTGEAYVVIYSRDHQRKFTELSLDEVHAVTRLWRDLYQDLVTRYPAVMIFETSGQAIGQTQTHPHGQAYGVAEIPPILERELETVLLEEEAGQGCPFCRVQHELTGQPYEVTGNQSWQAFLPPFARYPYETHLYPRRHVSDLTGLSDEELLELGQMMLGVIRGYNQLANGLMSPMPYMLGLHQLSDKRFHLHLEIQPVGRAPGKLKFAASSEALWGLWLNDSLPAEKARELSSAIAKGQAHE